MKAIKGGGNRILGLALLVVCLLGLSTPAQAGVAVNPSSVNFGSVAVGATSSTVQVTLTNNGSRRVNIVSVSASSSQFSYLGPASFTLQSSNSLTVGVAFRPTAAQSYSGSLTFMAGNGSTFTAPLSGTGASTQTPTITLTIDPTSVSLLPGAQQTFIATTHGGNNAGVTWTATCGTFTTDGWYGYYTAPAIAGSCIVTGRLTLIPTVSVSAPVTITSSATVAPSITTQPANRTVTAGQTAAFSATAGGTSPFSYQWKKNGAAISGATSASYATPATTMSDSGEQFTVVVANSAGNVTSTAAVLTVNAASTAPSITTQPANRTVTAGQTATFSVTAGGTSPFSYQWNKNGAAISGATSSSYTTPAATSSDSGAQFTVVVANSARTVTSTAAVLTVNAASTAPSITTQPASPTVTAGQTASFSVSVSGTSPFTYQWNRNGAAISGATSSTYTTPATTTSDSGAQLTVVVTNSVGSVTSNVAVLTVNASTSTITLTIDPTSVSLLPGGQQTFIATTHGGNNAGVTWTATCGTFTSDGWYGYYTAPATAGSCSVTGRLTLIATVSVSAPVTITSAATTAPSITTQPASRTVTAGQTAAFSVSASGTSPFTYQWNKNGIAISGATSSTYTTPATTTSDTGAQFTVVVTNSVGSVTSNAAVLTVSASTLLLTVNPTSLSFGNVNLNASTTKSATLTNSGTASVTISGVSYSGAGFATSGVSTGLILSPGQAVTLNVTFSPTATGSITGSIAIASNATGSPATLAVSGSGVQLTTHNANLSWIPSASTVVGYQVYSSTASGGPYARLTTSTVNLNSYTDSTVQSGKTYYYVVTAVDSSSMESVYSNQVSALIP